jgi:Protein of unknown function (DUF2950)
VAAAVAARAAAVVAVAGVAVVVVDGRSPAMHPSSNLQRESINVNLLRPWSFLRRLVLPLALALPLAAASAPQETFATPEAAVEALMAALKADGDAAIIAVFGEDHKNLVINPDPAQGRANRAKILAAMQTLRVLHEPTPERRVLLIGDQAWPVPIPIVRVGTRWRFATEEGEEEILHRRIGQNENNAITVLRAYLDAQRVYAERDRDGDGVRQFAQKLTSAPGKQDGLYWPADAAKGEELSPFGPLVADSAAYRKARGTAAVYLGYHFKILTQQGKGAPGGAHSYIINGRMIAGFAMVAYPEVYGDTGVMTFIVSHAGKVYEKDLGANSNALGAKMSTFDPAGWKEVAP